MQLRELLNKIMPRLRSGRTTSPQGSDEDSLLDVVKRGDFGNLTDLKVISLVDRQFNKELTRLQHAKSTIETGDAPTKGGLEGPEGHELTPSQLVFDADFPEVNRTFVSILSLKWLVAGQYDSFTAFQPPVVKLKPESFTALQALAKDTLANPNHLLALLVSIVIGDIGKDPALAEEVKENGGKLADDDNHDEVVYAAAQLELLPPLKLLRRSLRKDVLTGLKTGSKLNVPQLAQAENVPGSLENALSLKHQERAFGIKYLEILLDVAGAGGHIDARAATRMIEPVYQAFTIGRKALVDITAGKCTLRQGYDEVLTHRGNLLAATGFQLLSVDEPYERALLRLLAMGRVADKATAEMFRAAFFDALPQATRTSLTEGLSCDGYNDGEAIIPYYMPALFAEGLKTTKAASPATQTAALASLMRFLTRVFRGAKPLPDTPGRIVERDVSFAQDTVRSDAFRADPAVLDHIDIPFK